MSRAQDAGLPPRAIVFLRALGDDRRRPVLLRLSEGEASARQVAEDLDREYDAVNYVMRDLRPAGIVDLVRIERLAPGERRIYALSDEFAEFLRLIRDAVDDA